ncbi:DUF1648 domain-containing protein [Microbacterium sp. CPCC 204701]|uniref:DUF1648 domain-containing protein n=1 Tax=Microbacterium sp. CPCC 204701 TaxID=2493084 RepID=UPI000FDCA328|nr:DUF1648 domain-containing protein [Microbacterium sp. CPCC 204701]
MIVDHPQPDPRARRRFIQVGLLVPFVLTIVGVAIQLAVLASVPETVAIHWNGRGEPDGYGPAWTFPVLTFVLGVGISTLIGGLALGGTRQAPAQARGLPVRGRGVDLRFIGALLAASSAFMVALPTGLLLLQTEGTDAAASAALWIPAALLAAVAVGVLGWFAQPRTEPSEAGPSPAAPLPLRDGERAVWVRSVTMSRTPAVILVAVSLLMVAAGVWILIARAGPAGWVLFGVGLVLTAIVVSCVSSQVFVDDTGLRVQAVTGVPRFRVPLHEVESAEAVVVNPMAEFGGWGWRWAPGRFGVVLRTGEGLEVRRTTGRSFVVTVDDAATGAALLQALVERAKA